MTFAWLRTLLQQHGAAPATTQGGPAPAQPAPAASGHASSASGFFSALKRAPWRRAASSTLPRRTFNALMYLQGDAVRAGEEAGAVLDAQPPHPLQEQLQAMGDVHDARLALARGLSSIGHRDALPRHQVLQTHARLVLATSVLMETPCEPPLTAEDAQLLYMLAAAAQHYNSYVRLGGMPASSLPPLTMSALEDTRAIGWTSRAPAGGTQHISLSAEAFLEDQGTVLHEGSHEVQNNRLPLRRAETPRRFSARDAAISTTDHPRAGTLEAARQMRDKGDATWQRASETLYSAQPTEAQAFVDQAELMEMTAPYGKAYKRGKGLSRECGLDGLVPLIVQAMREVVKPGEQFASVADEAERRGGRPGFVIDDPRTSRLAERLLYDIGVLSQAMSSKDWTAGRAGDLTQLMNSLPEQVQAAAGRDKLETIARELFRFVSGLNPARIHIPATAEDDRGARHAAHAAMKAHPIEALSKVLELPEDQLGQALRAAKADSGFDAAAQRLQRLGKAVRPADVRDAVMLLAARLIGYPSLREVPADLIPEIDIVEPKRRRPRRFPGLNASPPPLHAPDGPPRASEGDRSSQAPKASFKPSVWQLQVPGEFFEPRQSASLPDRMAGLAGDFAFIVAAGIANVAPDGRITMRAVRAANLGGARRSYFPAKALQAMGLDPDPHPLRKPPERRKTGALPTPGGAVAPRAKAADVLEEVFPKSAMRPLDAPAHQTPPEPINSFLKDHPDSAASALRALVEGTPLLDRDVLWQEGMRAELKKRGQSNDDARQGYEAGATRHYQLAWSAWHRAVKAA